MEFLPPDDRMKNDVPPVFKRRSSSFKWVVLSMIGAILIFFGSVWVTTASWTPPPSSKDFSNVQDYMKALNDWKNSTQSGNLYGRITIELGAFVMLIGGFLGYIDVESDSEEKRVFLIISLFAILILVVVSVGLFMQSPYLS